MTVISRAEQPLDSQTLDPVRHALDPVRQALDTVRSFPTPEHIAFRHRTAGPLVRAAAWMIDLCVRGLGLMVLFIPVALLGFEFGIGLWLIAWFLADWLFGAFAEWRWKGVTPGKHLCHIRVVSQDGQPPSLAACLLRNVLRFADALPTPATGVVAMVLSGNFQRLGDLAAGTLVVYDERPLPARPASELEPEAARLAALLPPGDVARLSGDAARAIHIFVAERRRFHQARRQEMAEKLAEVLIARWDLPAATDPDLLLCAVHARLFGTSAEDSSALTGGVAARAIEYLAKRRPAWQSLEKWLVSTDAQPKADKPTDLSALYRAACADLALSNAYHLPSAVQGYLHHLVARAHARFYRAEPIRLSRWRDRVLVEVPGRLYGDMSLRVALLAFYGTFALCFALSAWQPDLAVKAIGQDGIDSLREMYAHTGDRQMDEGVLMGGFYINHNVGIALSCFASGMFAGVGSLVWLTFNGIALGCSFGAMTHADSATRQHFFTFVLAHGPFELTGITLAGAAGLRLGLGLVQTRGLVWRDSLRRAASEAVPILGVAATLVACAAPIEAFVSPSTLPAWSKAGIALACVLLLVLWLGVLGRRGSRILRERGA
jgi:uncharacterized membrane protein SpoIIM required for sporulation/uncharacterized RDD family membrane protein YckC